MNVTPASNKREATILLAKQGLSFPEIAELTGSTEMAIKTVVSAARQRGEPIPYKPRKPTVGSRAAELAIDGLGLREIARRLGTNVQTVRAMLSRERRRGVVIPGRPSAPDTDNWLTRKRAKKRQEITGLRPHAFDDPAPSPKFKIDIAARLAEIPQQDTRTLTQRLMGDPDPGDQRRARA